ncbi:hypothetical protein [Candidatus Viadribacter manganicus]|nr:hypothetical protein [Candidatus Viadribacter manganicus]
MQTNALLAVLWRSFGGVLGVAALIGIAFALDRFISQAGITLA